MTHPDRHTLESKSDALQIHLTEKWPFAFVPYETGRTVSRRGTIVPILFFSKYFSLARVKFYESTYYRVSNGLIPSEGNLRFR